MKRFFAIVFIVAAGCSEHNNKKGEASHHSRAESAMNNLVDSFKSDYVSAASAAEKDAVISKYQTRTEKFLSQHYLNHMRVHIDSLIINDLTIDTRFHAGRNLMFTSSTTFRKHMPKTEDSLYHFMQSLKQGTDTNIDFMYIGKFELRPPGDSGKPALIVNAYPLSYQIHGRR